MLDRYILESRQYVEAFVIYTVVLACSEYV